MIAGTLRRDARHRSCYKDWSVWPLALNEELGPVGKFRHKPGSPGVGRVSLSFLNLRKAIDLPFENVTYVYTLGLC